MLKHFSASSIKRCLMVVLLGLLTACADKPDFSPLPANTRVLAFGDSVTYGVGAQVGDDYPSQLAKLSNWDIVNAGVSGERADQGLQRIAATLEEHTPQLVLIELGGNDLLQRRGATEVKEDLRAIVREVKRFGAQPVLVAVPAVSAINAAMGRLADAALYAELAEEEAIPLIPDVFAETLSNAQWRADPIHPNATGYRQLAEGIAASLAGHGLLARP